jgi:tetratricopeptide (TPR) repeat protein
MVKAEAEIIEKDDGVELFAEQPDLARLLWALRRGRGFGLYFARCNVPVYRDRLIEALRSHLDRPVVSVEIPPDRGGDNISIDAIISRALPASSSDNAAIFVTGLEHLLPSTDPNLQSRTLQEMNWRRGALSKLNRPMVFWLPEFALTAVARNAPDLYDWYSGVYEFNLDRRAKAEATRSTLDSVYQRQSASWLSPVERKRWAATLHELIEQQDGGSPDNQFESELLDQLGKLAREQGDYATARKYHERALTLDEAAFGPDHPNVASGLNNLASVLQDLGDLGQARQLFERSLKIDEAAFGPDHPNVASGLNNLALVLKDLGDLGQARQLFERSLAIHRKFLGEDHPKTQLVKKNLEQLDAG